MWRALITALPLAHLFLARRYPSYGMPTIGRASSKRRGQNNIQPEAIAEIITLARSKQFNKLCRTFLPWQMQPPTSNDVASNATTFRVMIVYARQLRLQDRRS
jgi:hypothetical protein